MNEREISEIRRRFKPDNGVLYGLPYLNLMVIF